MTYEQYKNRSWYQLTKEEFIRIIRPEYNPDFQTKSLLYIFGSVFSFFAVEGALYGFKKAHREFYPNVQPQFEPMPHLVRMSMLIWGALFPLLTIFFVKFLLGVMALLISAHVLNSGYALLYILCNLVFTFFTFVRFERWRADVNNLIAESSRFGSARVADASEVQDLCVPGECLYLGNGNYGYVKQGHFLLCAGARGGKGTNILVQNLLGRSNYKGSWVVTDPKGELASITARYQKSIGQNVIVLDPWHITKLEAATYNPLDLLQASDPEHLIDSADVIAEMIIPLSTASKDPFWNDKARNILAGLLLHLALTVEGAELTLTTIWKWLRSTPDQWAELVAEMATSDNGIVKGIGHELIELKQSEKTYISIMSVLMQHTDFLKSPSLQKSLAHSSFDINSLSEGTTTIYIVIPADKLDTQSRWLRLVTTTALKAVVRKPRNRVTFMLDEFAALGKLPQIEIGMGAFAGYNITLMPVVQTLTQLKNLYGDNWETFLSNSVARQFFSISDEFSMNYLSNMLGEKTVVTYEKTATGSSPKSTARKLFTPDEIRRGSEKSIFLLLEHRPVILFDKWPYYEMPELAGRYDDNPYYKPTNGNEQ